MPVAGSKPSTNVRLRAMAHALGGELHNFAPVPDHSKWAWICPPHASGYRFETAQQAFDDLLRYLNNTHDEIFIPYPRR